MAAIGASPQPRVEVASSLDEALLGHAAALCDRLLHVGRRLGLVVAAEAPAVGAGLAPDDARTLLRGLRPTRATDGDGVADLDPLAAEVDRGRKRLRDVAARARQSGLAAVIERFGLSDDAVDALVLALAPDRDPRFARLMAYVHDDLARQRPSGAFLGYLGVALEAIERELVASGLVEWELGPPETSRALRPTAALLAVLRVPAATDGLLTRTWAQLHWPAVPKETFRAALVRALGDDEAPRLIAVEGLPGSGRASAVAATARALGRGVVMLDVRPREKAALHGALAEALLRARVGHGVALVRSDGAAAGGAEAVGEVARRQLSLPVTCVVLVSPGELDSLPEWVHLVRCAPPRATATERRAMWLEAAAAAGVPLDGHVAGVVASRYELTPGRIEEVAGNLAGRVACERLAAVEAGHVAAALREITCQRLSQVATLHVADETLDQLVLAEDVKERLRELVERLRCRFQVLEEWGLGRRSGRGNGASALFAGPPGTGKTAAAGAVARALDLDLHVVDLARVMSRWVGETEKNLARVFDEAEASGAALLFDEADALFGKRSAELRNATDRYANLTVNYLLTRIEAYGGLAILTTNLESQLDPALSRRLSAHVHFREPTDDERREMWRRLVPAALRLGADVDIDLLVRRYPFTGARIRNAIVRAAYLAAARGGSPVLAHDDLECAAGLEYEDAGRIQVRPRNDGREGRWSTIA